jgi:hypothetical protein
LEAAVAVILEAQEAETLAVVVVAAILEAEEAETSNSYLHFSCEESERN